MKQTSNEVAKLKLPRIKFQISKSFYGLIMISRTLGAKIEGKMKFKDQFEIVAGTQLKAFIKVLGSIAKFSEIYSFMLHISFLLLMLPSAILHPRAFLWVCSQSIFKLAKIPHLLLLPLKTNIKIIQAAKRRDQPLPMKHHITDSSVASSVTQLLAYSVHKSCTNPNSSLRFGLI